MFKGSKQTVRQKVVIVLLSGILTMQIVEALRTTTSVFGVVNGVMISRTYKVWAWEK